ncbi:hypothetical protein OHW54_03090 [Acinetobacter baumannii]|nr:hypothetical protein [Acinetobacter baumannii]
MNTYLKIAGTLPPGKPYLNLNKISVPQSLVNLGNIIRGYRFTSGLKDLTGEEGSQVVGTPTKTTEGYILGPDGYIDTGVKETDEFLWVTLVKVSSGGDYTPVISSFVEKAQSPTTYSLGCNLAKRITAVKLSNTSDSASVFTAANLTAGNWALMALSRCLIGTTGYAGYNFVCKPAGAALQKVSSNNFTPVANSSQNICIGWTPKGGNIIPKASTNVNLASVHNIGLDLTQLESLVNSLVTELATQDIIL